jgi:hypothetical protein
MARIELTMVLEIKIFLYISKVVGIEANHVS